jgi:hypothetical protein
MFLILRQSVNIIRPVTRKIQSSNSLSCEQAMPWRQGFDTDYIFYQNYHSRNFVFDLQADFEHKLTVYSVFHT